MIRLPRLQVGTVYLSKKGDRVVVHALQPDGFIGIEHEAEKAVHYFYELDGKFWGAKPDFHRNIDVEASEKMWAAEDEAASEDPKQPGATNQEPLDRAPEQQLFNMICVSVAPAFAAKYGTTQPHAAARDTVKFAKALMEEMKNEMDSTF